jgi:glycosyltransferase involved in cell wall biosynthesis
MKKKYFSLLLLIFVFGFKLQASHSKPTICLNMIVKNESKLIKRCLKSTKNFIDYWVIVDTGSTDGTQKIITDFMKGIPGELYERPWVDFAHNRNEALAFAKNKGDYVLFIDADDYLTFTDDFKKPYLDKDMYFVEINHGSLKHYKNIIVNNKLKWQWKGVLHEAIVCPNAITAGNIENMKNITSAEGCRSQDPNKYQNDAKVLEKALKKEPNNNRYRFYLAQSYRDAGNNELAIENYRKRVAAGGWDQEVFISLYQIAKIQERAGMPEQTFIESYFRAFTYRPTRIEPIYCMANYYRKKGNYELGYAISKMGFCLPPSGDALFIEEWMHQYGLLLELSICAYWLEKYEEAKYISEKMLERKDLNQNVCDCIKRNLKFTNQRIAENKQKNIVKK